MKKEKFDGISGGRILEKKITVLGATCIIGNSRRVSLKLYKIVS